MPLTIDVVSDVVCPWCFIGKRHLETAIRMYAAAGGMAPEVRWQPFQLNPDIPAGGLARKAYLEDKFGGPERAGQIYARVRQAGQLASIDFDFERIEVQPNTLDAHRLIHAAASLGRQDAMVETLFRAYFLEGADLSDHERLVELAARAEFSEQAARDYLASDEDVSLISNRDTQARQMGISGVPFFIFAGKLAVSGAHPAETLLSAMQQASAQIAS